MAAVPSKLDKKYMLLSACFPGIQPRKLTHKRYLEKKEEIRRTLKCGLGRKCSMPELPSAPAIPPVSTHKHPLNTISDPLDSSCLLPRLTHASTDFTNSIDTPMLTRLKPAVSGLWSRKLATVQKKFRDFEHVKANVRRTL
jgi:hypothetical protein